MMSRNSILFSLVLPHDSVAVSVDCSVCHVGGVIVLQMHRMLQESWWKEPEIDGVLSDTRSCGFVEWFLAVVALVLL
jgi:hypothetical protein